MAKRLLFSTFLNIGIIALSYSSFIAFNNQQYGILVAAILSIAVLIYMKIKILKQVRQINNNKN